MFPHQRRQDTSSNDRPCPRGKQILDVLHNLYLKVAAHVWFCMHEISLSFHNTLRTVNQGLSGFLLVLRTEFLKPKAYFTASHFRRWHCWRCGALPFFTPPVALNCSTHLKMLSREHGVSPYAVLNFLWTPVLILFLPSTTRSSLLLHGHHPQSSWPLASAISPMSLSLKLHTSTVPSVQAVA
jgi:hypothetical protein